MSMPLKYILRSVGRLLDELSRYFCATQDSLSRELEELRVRGWGGLLRGL